MRNESEKIEVGKFPKEISTKLVVIYSYLQDKVNLVQGNRHFTLEQLPLVTDKRNGKIGRDSKQLPPLIHPYLGQMTPLS